LKKLSKSEGDEEDDEEEDEEKGIEASDEKTTYEKFYDEFKMFLLLGCHEDDANRSKLAKLLRFISSYTEAQDVKKLTSLEDYVGRMQDEQPAIYYMSGEKVKEMEREAALEIFKKKGLEVAIDNADKGIADAEETISSTKAEIEALADAIKALDKSVTEATEQRQEEHAAYTDLMANNGAAKELIEFAKNRLQKFYNPALHVAARKREPTEEERAIMAAGGEVDLTVAPKQIAGTQQFAFIQLHKAQEEDEAKPPPPPETASYEKKGQKSNAIMSLMDKLSNDLKNEIKDAEHAEQSAQKDYEELLDDASKTKKATTKAIADKSASKAEIEGKREEAKSEHLTTEEALVACKAYIADLHQSCDFIVANFEARREQRESEIEGLKNAKAVLAGADYQ